MSATAFVRSGEIELKITLKPSWLGKSLMEALVLPFVKAYNKRVGLDGDHVSCRCAPAALRGLWPEKELVTLAALFAQGPLQRARRRPCDQPDALRVGGSQPGRTCAVGRQAYSY